MEEGEICAGKVQVRRTDAPWIQSWKYRPTWVCLSVSVSVQSGPTPVLSIDVSELARRDTQTHTGIYAALRH